MQTFSKFLVVSFFITLLAGCAVPNSAEVDPLMKYNRRTYAFNNALDKAFIRPVAKVYVALTPPQVRKGVTNFFDNIGEMNTGANDLLQGKFKYFCVDFMRFAINSTIGIGGIFDVASKMGLPRHYEDFGLTLAYWSNDSHSPYLVLPVFGPSTARDTLGLPADAAASPFPWIRPYWISIAFRSLQLVNRRAHYLDVDPVIREQVDPYIFVRNAYLQIRTKMIEDNLKPFTPANAAEQSGDEVSAHTLGIGDRDTRMPTPSDVRSSGDKGDLVTGH